MASLTYPLPRQYPITTTFGAMAALGGGRHWAVDFGAPFGTPILAAAAGVVTFAGWNVGGGNVTKIDHGGYTTEYAHQALRMVTVGQQVRAGQQIGTVGSTGAFVTGAHLHFALRIDGTAESDPKNNPMLYLGGGSGLPTATLTGGPGATSPSSCAPPAGNYGALFPVPREKAACGCPPGYKLAGVDPKILTLNPFGTGPYNTSWAGAQSLDETPLFREGIDSHALRLACVRDDVGTGPAADDIIGDAAGSLFNLVLPPLLEPAVNVAVVAGGLFLIYKGVRTMLT